MPVIPERADLAQPTGPDLKISMNLDDEVCSPKSWLAEAIHEFKSLSDRVL